jgi:site-specific DNA-methyltransferase (adenine-specific)
MAGFGAAILHSRQRNRPSIRFGRIFRNRAAEAASRQGWRLADPAFVRWPPARAAAALYRLGALLNRVLVPGGNVMVASNPLLSHIVGSAMSEGGLELRGNIIRLVMTMRGGDRPKNAHKEFQNVSVMPRSMFEPWVILRRPIEGRVQDNLRRPSPERPFGDVIPSRPTPKAEREIAAHPSLKPQLFLRQVVRAALPLGEGTVLDPFAGSGSTLAAANAVGYASIGIENDAKYVKVASKAIAKLASLGETDPVCSPDERSEIRVTDGARRS